MNEFFQQTAQREFQQALRDLPGAKQFQSALNKSLTRYDKLIATTIDEATTKPACRAGCAFCCYYKVEVRAHEVLNIRDYLNKQLSQALREKILQEVEQNAGLIRNMTSEQQLTTNLKCPLLQDNQCSAYPVRPYRCRNFHATDASACEASFADPANMDIATGMVETLAIVADAHSQGFEAAIEHQGLDARVYDFTTALQEACADDNCVKRYLRGKKAFQQAVEVL